VIRSIPLTGIGGGIFVAGLVALIQGVAAGLGADSLNPVLDPEPGHCCVAIPAATHDMNGTT
jgi:hypothetical protein